MTLSLALLEAATEGAFLAIPPLESAVFGAIWTLLGLFVGSFLNVCIHRFPLDDQSVFQPARSHCPGCERQLTWSENIPVLSWALQRAKCKGCGNSIHWRYPLVEILGAAAFFAAWHVASNGAVLGSEATGPVDPAPMAAWGRLVVISMVLAGLIVATFVDFDRFEIPDQVSIGGMWIAPIASWIVPSLHARGPIATRLAGDGPVDSIAALAECGAGMALGGGFLYAVGWIGKRVYKAEAMGFGDVKLMAAGGGFIGTLGVAAALVIAVLTASVFGVLNILRFYHLLRSRARSRKQPNRGVPRAFQRARLYGRYLPFGPYLALGIGIVLLDWKDVLTLLPFSL